MVAGHQELLAIEPPQVRIVISEREISDVIDGVAGLHAVVPADDHVLVHLVDGGERTLGELDDALVAEMVVGGEKCGHFGYSSFVTK